MIDLTLPGAIREQLDGVAAAKSLRIAVKFGPFCSKDSLTYWLVFHQRSFHELSIAVLARRKLCLLRVQKLLVLLTCYCLL